MNIKHLFFCMLLMTFSSCSKPGYEKAIAEWVQTDSQGTWTPTHQNMWAIHYTTILSLINEILSRTKFRIRS